MVFLGENLLVLLNEIGVFNIFNNRLDVLEFCWIFM